MSILHIHTLAPNPNPETVERNRVARLTWQDQLWLDRPVKDEDLPRLWQEEGRAFPYIKDVLNVALKDAADTDIACYTNEDICVRSDLCIQLAAAMQETEACYSFRRDFNTDFHAPKTDAEILQGDRYAGSDLKAFRVFWWKKWRAQMPDLILGAEAWDPCFRVLIEQTNPRCTVGFDDWIYHRRHGSYWEKPENRMRLRMQQYCRRLAAEFLARHGINPRQHGL